MFESEEDTGRFLKERFGSALEALGFAGPRPPTPVLAGTQPLDVDVRPLVAELSSRRCLVRTNVAC